MSLPRRRASRCPTGYTTVWGFFASKGASLEITTRFSGEFGKRTLWRFRAEVGHEPSRWARLHYEDTARGRIYPLTHLYILEAVWKELRLDDRLG